MAKDKTNVLIVDDHSVVTEGIKGVLKQEEDFEVVGTAPDGCKALSMMKFLKPDIVILDRLLSSRLTCLYPTPEKHHSKKPMKKCLCIPVRQCPYLVACAIGQK